MAGITGRTLLGRTEDTARFAIHMERDIREALFFAFAEAGLPLLELRPRTASLEEVFLDLTDDNDTVAARAAALFQTSVETAEKEAVGVKAIYKREAQLLFQLHDRLDLRGGSDGLHRHLFLCLQPVSGIPLFLPLSGSSLFIFMVVVPILTMRSMADERHTKTDQLLLTAPVSVTAVVLGKYFAMLTVFAVPVAIACLCPLIIALNGTAFLLADYGAILAFFLLGAVEIAVGMLISSLTESQIIARSGHLRPAAPAVSVGTAWWAFCPPPPSGLCWASSWC